MTRTRIKICGITRIEDALAAARAGADAVGMVFYPAAARCISHDRAREILAALPAFVTPVGLFVDAAVDEVRQTARSLGLRHVQLHGHEDVGYMRSLGEFVVLKAVRVDRETFVAELAMLREAIHGGNLTNLRGIVLETPSAGPGGMGLTNDWSFVRACRESGEFEGIPPIIAAGGLTPGNVGQVVRDIRPWAVDVSSGVEGSKGIKSAEKIGEFARVVEQTSVEIG